ncbi:hypothetical protein ES703_55049 [subsurface metagenome]
MITHINGIRVIKVVGPRRQVSSDKRRARVSGIDARTVAVLSRAGLAKIVVVILLGETGYYKVRVLTNDGVGQRQIKQRPH